MSTEVKGRVRYFYGKSQHASDVANIAERFLISENLETQILQAKDTIIVQGKPKPGFWKKAVGLSQAATAWISPEGNDLKITLGGAKWGDKVSGAAIGLILFVPVLFVTGWGVYKQEQLFTRLEKDIESYLATK